MTLPVHVPFYDDETPLSFASRLAANNGYSSLASMLGFMGLNWRRIWRAHPEALQVLGLWSGQSMERRLRYRGPQVWPEKTRTFGHASLMPLNRQGVDTVRCCPACLVEDLSRSGREIGRPYIRAWWMIAEIENCPTHKRPLVFLPPAERAANEDLVRRIYEHLPKFKEDASADIVVPTEFDEFILGRINGKPTPSFLGEIETHIAIGFCTRLGSDLLAAEARSDISASEFGYAVACHGPDAIVEAMRNAYRAKPDRSGPWFDHFPALGPWITLKVGRPQYDTVVNIVREALAWCLPIGPNDAVLGGVTRRLHTLKSASKEFGLSQGRIRAITRKAGILDDSHLGRSKETFDAANGEKLLKAVLTSVDPAEACRLLGTGKFQLRRLCETGVLNNVSGQLNYNKRRIRVERAELNALLAALHRRVTHVEQAEGLSTLSDAARASSLDYCAVLQMILSGDLLNVVYVGSKCNLATVRFDPEELVARKRLPTPESVFTSPKFRTSGNEQSFVLSSEFRTLALTDLTDMQDATAYDLLTRMRWPETQGKPPYCPKCGTLQCRVDTYKPNRYMCTKATCKFVITVTSGTPLHGMRVNPKQILIALWYSVHDKAPRKLSSEIGVQYKTARALMMKLRGAWRWEETSREVKGTEGECAAEDVGSPVPALHLVQSRGSRSLES
ncbi:TniQ family protein [Sinorhizobium fredii]|nr:TniQ family protein [Sinorhizobium fredii]